MVVDTSGTCARFKYLGKIHELPLPGDRINLHDVASSYFGIPSARMKLIVKGKAYTSENSAALLEAHLSSGIVIMVVGTQARDHLDSTQKRIKAGRETVLSILVGLPGLLWGCISAFVLFCWLFVKSMFVKAPPRQPENDHLHQVAHHGNQWQEVD